MQNGTVPEELSEAAFHFDPYKFDTSVTVDEDNFLHTLDENFTKCILKRGLLYSTTGLRNLQYSLSSLQHFSSLFVNDINHQESNDSQSETFAVELKPLTAEMQHPSPLKISVQKLGDKPQFVYIGVFFSWRDTDIRPCREYLNMSFLFVTGSQKYISIMNSLFPKYFDCKIAPIIYTQSEIKWLLAIMIHCVDESYTDDIMLTYQMNFDQSKLEFAYHFSDLKEIWNNIHDENESIIKYEDVVRLYAAIDEHILESSSLDLNHYLLKRFSIPKLITLDTENKICSLKPGAFDLVCRFIKERRLR